MKQLIFVARHFTPNIGSYAGMIEEVAKYAHSKGYKVKILCAQVNKALKLNEKFNYAEIIRFPVFHFQVPLLGMNKDYILLAFQVKKYFRKYPPDRKTLILANSRAALSLSGLPYVMRIGQPALVVLKNMEIAKEHVNLITRIARTRHFSFQYFLEKKCVKNAMAYIASSEESRKHNSNQYGSEGKPFFAPHSGVKYLELQKGNRLDIKGRKLLFISAGTEKVRKGIVYLEQALPALFKKYDDLKLIHVGKEFNWEVPDWCKRKIISVGMVPWKDIPNYYKTADLLVVCSLNELIPNIVFEAMAAGTPVISSDMIGMNEVITHLKHGYLYKKDNVKELIKGISYMLNNKNERKKMSTRAKKEAKNLNYNNYAKLLLEYMVNTTEGKKQPSINLLEVDS